MIAVLTVTGVLSWSMAYAKTAGDINDDGVINGKDLTRLKRYLAGDEVVVNEITSLDANGDGTCNTKDLTRLMKYLSGTAELAEIPTNTETETETDEVTVTYILNTSSKKVHQPTCGSVKTISAANYQEYGGTLEELLAQGYSTCGKCFTAVETPVIPPYAGEPYVLLNDNIPVFSEDELTTVAYESYGALDELGRCGAAVATCGIEIMPAEGEERGSISHISPTGWVQAQYDCVSGKYLYNRAHLIGWQLSAENANRQNLITGTRYLNTSGMLPFENMVADYILETGNHVAYRVTPIFEGGNLLCSGVQMEAYSIEDGGEGICFNVYCYNVQPGVVIDYATGESYLEDGGFTETETETETETMTESETEAAEREGTYVLNTATKKIHDPTCSYAASITEANCQTYTGYLSDLTEQGYVTCGRCF
jgi:DNA-entry nuclease